MRAHPASTRALAFHPRTAAAHGLLLVLLGGGCATDRSRNGGLTVTADAGAGVTAATPASAPTGGTLAEDDIRLVIAVRARIAAETAERQALLRARADALAEGRPLPPGVERTPPSGSDVARSLGLDVQRHAWAAARVAELVAAQQRLAELDSTERFRRAHLAILTRERALASGAAESATLDEMAAEVAAGTRREQAELSRYRTPAVAGEMELLDAHREALGLPVRPAAVAPAGGAGAARETSAVRPESEGGSATPPTDEDPPEAGATPVDGGTAAAVEGLPAAGLPPAVPEPSPARP